MGTGRTSRPWIKHVAVSLSSIEKSYIFLFLNFSLMLCCESAVRSKDVHWLTLSLWFMYCTLIELNPTATSCRSQICTHQHTYTHINKLINNWETNVKKETSKWVCPIKTSVSNFILTKRATLIEEFIMKHWFNVLSFMLWSLYFSTTFGFNVSWNCFNNGHGNKYFKINHN